MKTTLMLGWIALLASGCVSKGKYDDAVAQTEITRAQLDAELRGKDAQLAKTRAEEAREHAALDEIQAILANTAASEKVARDRAALFEDIARRLQSEVDAGDLVVVVRDGRMVLQLPNDVLFDSGRTEIKPGGTRTLDAVADVLRIFPKRHFQVAGHTDDVPIARSAFATNWELSSARALHVVHYLIDKGVPAGALSGAGYADVDPIGSNATPEGRKRNRRTEITLQPNINEIVRAPGADEPPPIE